jgi:hypothetical protein
MRDRGDFSLTATPLALAPSHSDDPADDAIQEEQPALSQ